MIYIQKDIIQALKDGDIKILAHQCNCITGHNVKGLAKQIYDLVPNKEIFSNNEFGAIKVHHYQEDKLIINVYAQYYPGPPSETEIPLDVISAIYSLNVPNKQDTIATRLLVWIHLFEKLKAAKAKAKIGIPLIGSGLAKPKEFSNLSSLKYFQQEIAPVLKPFVKGLNLFVYYLP